MSFARVVGQESAVAALRAQLARTGGQGATLIVGPPGVGRFLLAQCAATAILGDAARVEAGTHPDLFVLDPAMGIDGVRDAAMTLARRPLAGPRQVLLVRDADRLSIEALNALLKTLEEPPAGAAIFLVAEDAALLPETVVSRCRLVRALPLRERETAEVLARHGGPREGAADAEGAPGLAFGREAQGVPGDATALLEAMAGRSEDPLGDVERIVRKRKDEDAGAQRARLEDTCRVAAARLRRGLPGTEGALRRVVNALGSLHANANPSIVLAELALTPWTRDRR
jgi:replication-associated recombination protein RarA